MKRFLNKKTLVAAICAAAIIPSASAQLSLTILHNNDGESKVVPLTGSDANHGGAAHFVGLVTSEKARATTNGREVLTVSAGDNFLAGTAFAAGQGVANGGDPNTYYDARILNAIGYDAVAFGNHDFDFGTTTLAEFIGQTNGSTFYVNTNANFAGDPALNAIFGTKLVKSRVVTKGGQKIGIVAAITPQLPTISSPGGVTVPTATLADIAAAINAETDAIKLADPTVKIFVLLSHLQSLNEEVALTPQLVDIDVVVSGGGSEFLRVTAPPHPAGEVLPSDVNTAKFGNYPIAATRTADSKPVSIVTTKGEYRYLGRLEVDFDIDGHITASTAGNLPGTTDAADGPLPVKHAGLGAGPIVPDATIQTDVVDPVNAFVAALSANILDGSIEVALDGTRTSVRSKETNEGNLLADALLFKAKELAALSGGTVDSPVIAFTNGGGMRKDSVIALGTNFTELTTFEIAPFANFLAVMEDVTPAQLKSLLENAYSQTSKITASGLPQSTGAFTGRFAQIAGMTVNYNILGTASTLNAQGTAITDGARVRDVTLTDGTQVFIDGVVNPALPPGFTVDVATIDFLARGGDGYPVAGTTFSQFIGTTYQNALEDYIVGSLGNGGLGGLIDAARYAGPVGRVVPQSRPDALAGTKTPVSRTAVNISTPIRTNGYPTTVQIDYGPTVSYGSTLTLPGSLAAQPLGTSTGTVFNLTGLTTGVVYQYRITATNELGTTTSLSTFTPLPNAAPVAVADAFFVGATTTGVPVEIAIAGLLANDTDGNTDTLTLTKVSAPIGGTIAKRGANVLFTPHSGYTGFGSFSYTIADGFGGVSTAEVLVRSSKALTASYVAAIDGGSGQNGFASIKLGKANAFSGSLVLNGVKSSFKGTLANDGTASVVIARGTLPSLTLGLAFNVTGDLATFEGTLSDGTDDLVLTGERAADAALIADHLGQFNLTLPTDVGGPGGAGYAVVKVSKGGKVTIAGKLSDGTSLSVGTVVKSDLEIPVFAALYKSVDGLVAGSLGFPDAGTLTGDLGWTKPAVANTPYPLGFDTSIAATGTRYVKPVAPGLPAGFDVAPAAFTLVLSEGGIVAPLTKLGTLAGTGIATITSANAELVAVKVNLSNGLISGSFTLAAKVTPIRGVLFDAGVGAGSFVAPTVSGKLTLTAN